MKKDFSITSYRSYEIDNLRGIAFILMIIHHIFYFYNNIKYNIGRVPDWVNVVGTIARYIFILLTGVSLVKAYKNNYTLSKRFQKSFKIFFHAMLITLITYYYFPNKFIRFGVLHFISISTLLLSFIVPYKFLYIPLFFLISSIHIYNIIPSINTPIDTILGTNTSYYMLDWFPLLRWIPIVLLGMIIGDNFDFSLLSSFNNKFLIYFGQNALNLYTLHIYFLIIFYSLIK